MFSDFLLTHKVQDKPTARNTIKDDSEKLSTDEAPPDLVEDEADPEEELVEEVELVVDDASPNGLMVTVELLRHCPAGNSVALDVKVMSAH